jgi:hypothetical protein
MYGANRLTKTAATPGQFLVSQTCFTVLARIRGSLYTKHSLCGAHERQGPEAFSGTELARGARSIFADLNKYAATMHFVGQSTILSLTADRGTGEAHCLAHHL